MMLSHLLNGSAWQLSHMKAPPQVGSLKRSRWSFVEGPSAPLWQGVKEDVWESVGEYVGKDVGEDVYVKDVEATSAMKVNNYVYFVMFMLITGS